MELGVRYFRPGSFARSEKNLKGSKIFFFTLIQGTKILGAAFFLFDK